MKKIFAFACLYCFTLQVMAQTPVKPKPIQLPAPKLKLPADLVVECYSLTARKDAAGETFINVTVAVQNNGQVASLPATIRGLISTNPANKATITTPPVHYYGDAKPMGSWKFCNSAPEVEIGAVAPGGTVRTAFEFKIPTAQLDRMKSIFFCVLVDYYKRTMESNENNNMSAPLQFLNPNY